MTIDWRELMNKTEEKYIIEVYFEDVGETFYVGKDPFSSHKYVLVRDPMNAIKYTYNSAKSAIIQYDYSTEWRDTSGTVILTGDIFNRPGYDVKIKKMTIQYTW